MKTIKIAKVGSSRVTEYACDELMRYLRIMDKSLLIECSSYPDFTPEILDCIAVGISDRAWENEDDAVCVEIRKGRGVITGANERSVLFAVYRFLYELGCRFYRYRAAGADTDGCEYIPNKSINPDELNISVDEAASYRHRSICIEGSDAYEHIEAVINWLPKVGLNGYYVQFKTPHTFFNNWTEKQTGERLTRERVDAIYRKVREDVKKRGLSLHAVGHGWTCEPLGLDGSGWYEADISELPEDKRNYLAEVNGVRGYYQNVPLNTNLCYSNPDVRALMTDAICEYCAQNPEVDYLHFWLADSRNAQCECGECVKMRPSDYYVMMLNEIDEKLTERGIKTKIVFLIYYDLLWRSLSEQIKNPERFVLMFAPITRTYSHSFTDYDMNTVPEPPEYRRNDFSLPRDVGENLAFLKDWQKNFTGDSFDFDYHLMWDHVRDVGYYNSARILHRDMCNLDKAGLNGMVSCQIQRASYPSNLPMYAMARGLWDKNSDFDRISDEYFKAEYGECGEKICEYMRHISDGICLPYFRRERDALDAELHEKYDDLYKYVIDFRDRVISPNREKGASWEYLYHHSVITGMIIRALEERTVGNAAGMEKYLDNLEEYARQHEPLLHKILDVGNFVYVIRGSMKQK